MGQCHTTMYHWCWTLFQLCFAEERSTVMLVHAIILEVTEEFIYFRRTVPAHSQWAFPKGRNSWASLFPFPNWKMSGGKERKKIKLKITVCKDKTLNVFTHEITMLYKEERPINYRQSSWVPRKHYIVRAFYCTCLNVTWSLQVLFNVLCR